MKICFEVKESYKELFEELKEGEYPGYEDYIKVFSRKEYKRTEPWEPWEYNKAFFAYMIDSEYNKRLYGTDEDLLRMKEAMNRCIAIDSDLVRISEEKKSRIGIYVDDSYEEKFNELIEDTDNCTKVHMFKYLLFQAMFDCNLIENETYEDRIEHIEGFAEETLKEIHDVEDEIRRLRIVLEEKYDYLQHLVISKRITFNISNYRRTGRIDNLEKLEDLIKLADMKIDEFESR